MKENKKIGKLLELLNEYEPYIASDGEHRDNLWRYAYQGHSAVFPKEFAESYIISARYGFIKWLVENEKVEENSDLITLASELGCAFSSDVLLMYLAIQDEPIEFLVSILK